MKYYTYAYLREDKTPYYIGKGTRDRIFSRNRKFKPPKDKSRIIFLKKNMTEKEAFNHERYMIAIFGRKDIGTGILHNKTNGGEGCSGVIRSRETREKMSIAKKSMSEETKRKIGKAHKGKIVSKDTRRKLRERNLNNNISLYQYKIYSIIDDKVYETNNLNAFCRDYAIDRRHIINTLNGNRKQHKGFILIEKFRIQK